MPWNSPYNIRYMYWYLRVGWMNLHGLKKAHFHYPCSLWDPQKWPWIRGIYRNKIFGHFSYKSNVGKEQWDHKRIGIGSRLHIVWHFSEHGYEYSLSFPVIKGKIENLIILLQSKIVVNLKKNILTMKVLTLPHLRHIGVFRNFVSMARMVDIFLMLYFWGR